VFLATGTGVAPFKSMIDYVFGTGRDEYGGVERDVWPFLGAAWRDDLPYREAFRGLVRTHENSMVYSLGRTVERLGVPESRIESEGFG